MRQERRLKELAKGVKTERAKLVTASASEGSTHEPQLGDILLTRVRQIPLPMPLKSFPYKRERTNLKKWSLFSVLGSQTPQQGLSKERKCAVDGCQSDQHSSYLHEGTTRRTAMNPGLTISPQTPAFYPRQPSAVGLEAGI